MGVSADRETSIDGLSSLAFHFLFYKEPHLIRIHQEHHPKSESKQPPLPEEETDEELENKSQNDREFPHGADPEGEGEHEHESFCKVESPIKEEGGERKRSEEHTSELQS